MRQLSARSTRLVKRGVDRGDAGGEGRWVFVGGGKRENIRLSIICVRHGVRRRGLESGRMMVRVTTMSMGSTRVGEVAHVSVVEVEGEYVHDPSKSEPSPSKRSTKTSWSSPIPSTSGRLVLAQRPCLIISLVVLVLKSETSLMRVRRRGSKRCASRGL